MPDPRRLLFLERSSVFYHCVSRVVDRNYVFDVHERDVFRKILRQVEGFCGVRVVTWTILSNHFHVLVEVPPVPEVALADGEILDRCRSLYSTGSMVAVELDYEDARRTGGDVLEKWRSRYLRRMWSLSEFMKTLKQKFTGWFNRKYERVGTLWESRFKSVIVEGSWQCLLKVAAYVDLNAVRAGLVKDPKDYRWCGYAEAVVGDRLARRGLAVALSQEKPDANWRDVGPRYRKILFGIGEGHSARAGLSREAVAKVWAAGGKLTLAQLLRCRIRYFTDGMAVGSTAFVEKVFVSNRAAFSSGRRSGARRMKGGGWGELRTVRDLKAAVLSASGDG
jgi:REP element-mobilizing transposase RayT